MRRGWTHDPARHALAAKGVKTRLGKPLAPRLTGSQIEFRSQLEKRFKLAPDVMEDAYFEVEIAAVDEGGDENGAQALVHDSKWFETISGDISLRFGHDADEQRRIKEFLYYMYGVRADLDKKIDRIRTSAVTRGETTEYETLELDRLGDEQINLHLKLRGLSNER